MNITEKKITTADREHALRLGDGVTTTHISYVLSLHMGAALNRAAPEPSNHDLTTNKH